LLFGLYANWQNMTRSADIRIGISGWQYEGWEGTFYPEKLSAKKQLPFAAEHFNSIELNGFFLCAPEAAKLQKLERADPGGFCFFSESAAIHYAHSPAEGLRGTGCQLLRAGDSAAWKEARTNSVAASAHLQV
jgi:hypothetical protein